MHNNADKTVFITGMLFFERYKEIFFRENVLWKMVRVVNFLNFGNGLRKDWRNYPIMKNMVTADCIYKSFDDFRSDTKTIAGSIKQIIINDSLYNFSFKYPDSSNFLLSPYAVVKDVITYVWLMYNTYVRLDKSNKGFHFQVPSSLLNLYEICSLELIYSKRPPSLILIVGLIGELAINAVDQIIKDKKPFKNSKKSG